MNCPKCGTTLADDAKFCANCGANLARDTTSSVGAPPPPPPNIGSPSPQPATSLAASSPMLSRLIARVKAILVTPQTEWPVIEREPTTAADIYKGYVAPLAAIGAIASFIGLSMVGVGGILRIGVGAALIHAIVSYLLAFVNVWVVAWLIDVLAPTFGGQRDSLRALKVTAYSYTPAWIAGIVGLIPILGILALIASLYGLYLLYLGLPVLMRNPQDKSIGYTVVVVLCAIGVAIVFGMLSSCLIGGAAMMGRGSI